MESILENIGLHKVVEVTKSRREARLSNMTICMDHVDKLGDFIEIEQLTLDGDSLKIQEDIMIFLESIGITREQRVTSGYDTLVNNLNSAGS